MNVLLTEISSIINSTFDCPCHSFKDNLPAILNNFLFFSSKYAPISFSTQLNAIDLTVDPSNPTKTDFMCLSFIILLLIDFIFSKTNFGSGFPDPNGASMILDPSMLDATSNDDGANWCESTSALSTGDLGTPGAANDTCAAPQSFTYTADIAPILNNCTGCHGNAGGFALNYNNLFTASSIGMNYITPGDPSQSYLWHKINGTQSSVGGSGSKMGNLSNSQLSTIEEWITQGAPQ